MVYFCRPVRRPTWADQSHPLPLLACLQGDTQLRLAAAPPTPPACRPQAALQAVLKSSSGGVLYFPAGTYVLSRPLFANASNIVVRGAGREATRLLFTRSLSQVYGIQWGVDNCTGGAAAGLDGLNLLCVLVCVCTFRGSARPG